MPSKPSVPFDVTAGRRARAIARHLSVVRESTDPTAGRRAQAIARRPDVAQPSFDPTDPRCEEMPTGRVRS